MSLLAREIVKACRRNSIKMARTLTAVRPFHSRVISSKVTMNSLFRNLKLSESQLFSTQVKRAASTVVECPALGDSVLEGDVIEWKKNVGDYVEEDETLLVLETAKVSVDIPSPVSGVLTKQHLAVGAVANVGQPLCEIDSSAPKPEGKAAPKAAEAPKAPAAEKPTEAPKSTPPPKQAEAPKTTPVPAAPSTPAVTGREDRRVKMTRMRQTIAKRLKDSQNTLAMLTTFNEVDMTAAQNLRAEYKDAFEKKHGTKLGFMSLFLKASAAALQAFPDVNAYIDSETNEIVYRNYVDISVAVATPTGLVVPVVRNVEKLSFADVEKTVANYGAKARNGTISMDDFVGGTFTVSNGGVYGSLFGTPIINPPQSAILGMHSIVKRPVVVEGDKIEVRPMMYLALTYDHRLLDGATAVQFLKHIKASVEDPRRLILDM